MANHKSAEKRIRQTKPRTVCNHSRIGRIRTELRKVEEAISGGDKQQAQAAFKAFQPLFMSGVNHHMVHRNTVARKLSRLSTRIKALGA